jgi:hypothetical protein
MPTVASASASDILVRYPHTSWIKVARELYIGNDGLRKALVALSLGIIGRKDGRSWMMQEALKSYIDSLREVNIGLQKLSKGNQDAVLVTSRALGSYEVS